MRTCPQCKVTLPADAHKNRLFCSRKCNNTWHNHLPVNVANRKANAWEYNLHRYGIGVKEYQAQLKRQGGVCYICGKPPKLKRLAVDHDHKTKRLRGLLCSYCNYSLLGRGRENPDIHRRAADYLENPPWPM